MTINILGQDYDIQEVGSNDDARLTDDLDGYCDGWGKTIRLRNDYNTKNPSNVSDMEAYKRNVKRHEIVHAFFMECGMQKYHSDEVIIEWIAQQFPKLEKAFQQAGAL